MMPVPLMVAPMTLLSADLFDRHGFAGDHRFVDGAAAFEHDAIDGNFFSGAHAQAVAGLDLFERNVFLAAVGARVQARRLRSEIEQRADGGAGAAAGAQLHDLAEQDQSGDRGGGFEVDVGISARMPRKDAGKICGATVAITL